MFVNKFLIFFLHIIVASYEPCGKPEICFCTNIHISCASIETLPRFNEVRYHSTSKITITNLKIGIAEFSKFLNLESVLLKDSGILWCDIPDWTNIILMNTTCVNNLAHDLDTMQDKVDNVMIGIDTITSINGYIYSNTSTDAVNNMIEHNNIKLYLGILLVFIGVIIFILLLSVFLKKKYTNREPVAVELTVFNPNYGEYSKKQE